MTGIVSRVVVGVVGLPVVLALVWGGGWWLFGLLAFAAVVAVHEFVTVARTLRTLGPAAQDGADALAGEDMGGVRARFGGRHLRVVRRPLLRPRPLPRDLAGDPARCRRRVRGGRGRPLRVHAEAGHAGEGHGRTSGRPRRRARPHRLAALRGAGRVLPRPRLSLRLIPPW